MTHTPKLRQMIRVKLSRIPHEDLVTLHRACAAAVSDDKGAQALFAAYFGPGNGPLDYLFVSGICQDLLPDGDRILQGAPINLPPDEWMSRAPATRLLCSVSMLRAERNLTRKQLSELCGIYINQIARYEDSPRTIETMTLTNAVKLAHALGARADDLIPAI